MKTVNLIIKKFKNFFHLTRQQIKIRKKLEKAKKGREKKSSRIFYHSDSTVIKKIESKKRQHQCQQLETKLPVNFVKK